MNNWDEKSFGRMSFINICRKYSSDKNLTLDKEPPFIRAFDLINKDEKYTVRWNSYEVGSTHSGQTIGSDYYVLKGKCELIINGIAHNLQAGEFFTFPKGNYQFKVIGDENFEYVAVYKVPTNI